MNTLNRLIEYLEQKEYDKKYIVNKGSLLKMLYKADRELSVNFNNRQTLIDCVKHCKSDTDSVTIEQQVDNYLLKRNTV